MIDIQYLSKYEFEEYANQLFNILYDNMTKILPSDVSREEDFACWSEAMKDGLKADTRRIIIAFLKDTKEIIGYFQYSVNGDVLMMEEIEIATIYQGKENVFRRLYGYVLEHLENEICFTEAYANRRNTKSLGILARLGLSIVEKDDTGTRCHLRGRYEDLVKWYERK